MSILDRAVDLLDVAAPPQPERSPKPSLPPAHVTPLERAAALLDAEEARAAQRSTPEPEPETIRDPAPRAPRRSVTVSRALLRRQMLIVPEDKRNALTENFRRIKRHILASLNAADAPRGANLIMITSALPREGKTFCSVNLAISLSMEVDRGVLLVDADVAKPSVTATLGIHTENERGLMDVLLDRSIRLDEVVCDTDIPKLAVLPAGTRNQSATEMLSSNAMSELLETLIEEFPDHVIIFDSPPLLAASEAPVLATRMGQIAIVVEAGKTTETALKDALSRVESANVIGALLNKGAAPGAGVGGYGYGYGYDS